MIASIAVTPRASLPARSSSSTNLVISAALRPAVKNYLKDLRAILGDDPRAPRFIASEDGGYRFIATVNCPDGLPGPCNTRERLLPRAGTPTPAATRTSTPTDPPDPFATPTL